MGLRLNQFSESWDYDILQAPAFAGIASAAYDSGVDAVVGGLAETLADAEQAVDARALAAKQQAAALSVSDLREILIRSNTDLGDAGVTFFQEYFAAFQENMADFFRYRAARLAFAPDGAGKQEVFEALTRDGIWSAHLPPDMIAELNRLVTPHKTRALELIALRRSNRPEVGVDFTHPAAQLLESYLRDSGIYDAACAYKNATLERNQSGVFLACPAADFWVSGGAPTPTRWFHLDRHHGNIKIAVFLNKVTAAAGPFGYVRGSHRWSMPPLRRIAAKLPYPALAHPAYFARLPRAFRYTSSYGDIVGNDVPLVEELLAREVQVTAEVANFIVFDGGSLLHRGSMATKDLRWSYFYGFGVPKG
ncbi:MAG: hypothetical protein ACPGO3_07835 [Magnetospiraceae bacterium]